MSATAEKALRPLRLDPYYGWQLSPYAAAIADLYKTALPYYLYVPTNLSGTINQIRSSETPTNEDDCLVLGAHYVIGSSAAGDSGQQVYLNVTDDRTGLSWNSNTPFDSCPVSCVGGSGANAMPIVALPEAYFWPAGTQLLHRWTNASTSFSAVTGGQLVWVCVRLQNPKFQTRPECVTMPDGSTIRIGSRLPWFATVALGQEGFNGGVSRFSYLASVHDISFTDSGSFDIEIHGLNYNFATVAGVDQSPSLFRVALEEIGQGTITTVQTQLPVPEIAGEFSQVYPQLPFPRPYFLKAGHRVQLFTRNLTGNNFLNPLVTFTGVQLCQ